MIAIGLCGAAQPHGGDACLRGPFHGITATNEIGEVLGRPDASDWGCLGGGAPAPALIGAGIPPVQPPTEFCIHPASPNPVPGFTRLVLALPSSGPVSLAVWARRTGHGPPQVLRVRTLLHGEFVAGMHEVNWDGKDDQGVRLAPGIYRVVFSVAGGSVCGDIEIL